MATSDLLAIAFTKVFVSRRAQRRHRLLQVLALDQDIIAIKRRDRKDRDPRFRQRLQKRRQHAGHRKRERPFEFQRRPSAFGLRAFRHTILRADNRKLIVCAHYAEKSALECPRRNPGIGGKPAHRQPLQQNAVFQMVRQLRLADFRHLSRWAILVDAEDHDGTVFDLTKAFVQSDDTI
jgi:hypothetical protein